MWIYRLRNYICPSTRFPAVNSSPWPIVTGLSTVFVFRMTAPSLHIHKTIIFMLVFLYLEVNGCQGTNEAARNSCTSSPRFPRRADAGFKKQTSAFSPKEGGKKKKLKEANLLLSRTQHCVPGSFSLPSPAPLRQLVAHVPLICILHFHIHPEKNAASHYLAAQLLQASNS